MVSIAPNSSNRTKSQLASCPSFTYKPKSLPPALDAWEPTEGGRNQRKSVQDLVYRAVIACDNGLSQRWNSLDSLLQATVPDSLQGRGGGFWRRVSRDEYRPETNYQPVSLAVKNGPSVTEVIFPCYEEAAVRLSDLLLLRTLWKVPRQAFLVNISDFKRCTPDPAEILFAPPPVSFPL